MVYGFGPDSDFAGQLVGALERLEAGGALRIADAVFVLRDGESGELSAIDLGGRRMDAMVASLLEFRLDEARRRKMTERALGIEPARTLAAALQPGTAVAAVLIEHVWADGLEDAATRVGGSRLTEGFVDATGLADLTDELVSAARGLSSG